MRLRPRLFAMVLKVHSNVIATSLKDHQRFGGIIPEIASRRQIEFIHWVVAESLAKAQMTLEGY